MDVLRIFVLLAATLSPAMAGAEDTLPRVLILGDSVYRQPAAETAKALKGQAEVVYPAVESGTVLNSATVLEDLDELLGDGRWDVIHFNFGLGDLVHRAPGMSSFRALPKEVGGMRATPPEQYARNLRELIDRLTATDAKLIWASTTPLGNTADGIFEPESEVEYNAIAAKIMKEFKIPINDMHEYVENNIEGRGQPNPFSFNRLPLHPPMITAIKQALRAVQADR